MCTHSLFILLSSLVQSLQCFCKLISLLFYFGLIIIVFCSPHSSIKCFFKTHLLKPVFQTAFPQLNLFFELNHVQISYHHHPPTLPHLHLIPNANHNSNLFFPWPYLVTLLNCTLKSLCSTLQFNFFHKSLKMREHKPECSKWIVINNVQHFKREFINQKCSSESNADKLLFEGGKWQSSLIFNDDIHDSANVFNHILLFKFQPFNQKCWPLLHFFNLVKNLQK